MNFKAFSSPPPQKKRFLNMSIASVQTLWGKRENFFACIILSTTCVYPVGDKYSCATKIDNEIYGNVFPPTTIKA